MNYASSGTRGSKLKLGMVGQTFAKLRSGTKTVGATCAPIADSTPCWRVVLQADPNNGQGDDVLVGGRDGCHYQLQAGDSVEILINNLDKIYASAVAGSPVINWLVME